MTQKTSAIVLHQIKYTDNGIIVQLFTRHYGRQSVLVRGIRNRKRGNQNVFFQPLTLLDLVLSKKENTGVQTLREFSVLYTPASVYGNIVKSSMAIFLGEVLTSVLREEGPGEELFDYIKDSVIFLDTRKEGFPNFHIAFLIGLCSYLGFEPGKRTDPEHSVFDMVNGSFVAVPPAHGIYADTEMSGLLSDFFNSSWNEMNGIALTGLLRNELLSTILRYYSVHIPSMKRIYSLDILREVFG